MLKEQRTVESVSVESENVESENVLVYCVSNGAGKYYSAGDDDSPPSWSDDVRDATYFSSYQKCLELAVKLGGIVYFAEHTRAGCLAIGC